MNPSCTKMLTEWLAWLETLHIKNIDMSLERVQYVAAKLAIQTFPCPVITVGGTNGKGSTVALLESIYRAGGYQVGAYTSPHIVQFNERIRVNGYAVSDQCIVEAFEQIEQRRGEVTLTFFEYTTLAALLIFQQANLDMVLLEVGLGGRLDAVNIIDADVAIVTSIALDHTEWLGCTREAIAREKAGIFKPGKIAICGDPDPPQTLVEEALAKKAKFFVQGSDFGFTVDPHLQQWQWWSTTHQLDNLPLPHLAMQNISTALMAYFSLEKLPVKQSVLRQAIIDTTLFGRFQSVRTHPQVIVDVAHNPAAAYMLSKQITEKLKDYDRIIAVFSALADKDVTGIVANLSKQIHEWYIAPLPVTRGCPIADLYERTQKGGAEIIKQFDSVKDAYCAAILSSAPTSCILVFGSFYTVAEIINGEEGR